MINDILIIIDLKNKKSELEKFFVYHIDKQQIRQLISNKFLDNNLKLGCKETKLIDIDSFLKKMNVKKIDTVINLKKNLILNFESQKNIRNLLINKRVVIVGPADYVNCNDKINNYDIIVRVNKGLSQQGNGKCGDRTDILYHVVNQDKENGGPIELKFNGHIRFTYPILDYDEETTFKNIGTIRDYFQIYKDKDTYNHIQKDFSIINKLEYLEMEKILESRPNSGIATILDLLKFDIKELYITGFTLFQTNYSKDYRENVDGISGNSSKLALTRMSKTGHHDQEKAALVFKNQILNDKRVKYDQILGDCVNITLN